MLGQKEQIEASRIIQQLSKLSLEQKDTDSVQTEQVAYNEIVRTNAECRMIEVYLRELECVRQTIEKYRDVSKVSKQNERTKSLQSTNILCKQTEAIWTQKLIQKKRHIAEMRERIQNLQQAKKIAHTINNNEMYEQIKQAVLAQRGDNSES